MLKTKLLFLSIYEHLTFNKFIELGTCCTKVVTTEYVVIIITTYNTEYVVEIITTYSVVITFEKELQFCTRFVFCVGQLRVIFYILPVWSYLYFCKLSLPLFGGGVNN